MLNFNLGHSRFSILLTKDGVELYPGKVSNADAILICIVHHYQAALRIARQAAILYQYPLTVFVEDPQTPRSNACPSSLIPTGDSQ